MNALTYSRWIALSEFVYIVRNFSIVKSFDPRPIRLCRKKIGPGDVSFTRAAMISSTGANSASKAALPMMSSPRFRRSAATLRPPGSASAGIGSASSSGDAG